MKRIDVSDRIARVRLQRKRDRKRSARKPGASREVSVPDGALRRDGYRVIKAPKVLGFSTENVEVSLAYVDRVRAAALEPGRGAFVDLSDCTEITPVLCLILGAEMERCRGLKPKSVIGRDPRATEPRGLLRKMGFHRCLGIGGRRRAPADRVLEIRTGNLNSDVSKELEDVASVAERVFGDRALANRVHGAMNEAMLNVRMHAYHPDFYVPGTALEGQWWVCGFYSPEDGGVAFLAYDQGVGIPRTAPKTMGQEFIMALDEMLGTVGLQVVNAADHQIIGAAIKARLTRTKLPQHGKGLTSMIKLVDIAGEGSVMIVSGRGAYLYRREGSEEPMEETGPLTYGIPGTLVFWFLHSRRGAEVAE
jgi:hypothetical protein